MALEIERKFQVRSDSWRAKARSAQQLRQGYLTIEAPRTLAEVRVRRTPSGAFLTIKGKGELVRAEFEYEIPVEDADAMLKGLCGSSIVEKMRYEVEHAGAVWHVDEFLGANSGLILAEVELKDEDQSVQLPDWLGTEVTTDKRYRNSNLAVNPGFWR